MNSLQTTILCDMHTHSENSHDGKTTVIDTAQMCLKNGVFAFAVTDHCDIHLASEIDIFKLVKNSLDEVENAKNQLGNSVKIFKGIEIGETIWNKPYADKILNAFPFDVVIGSVHSVRDDGYTEPYSTIDFSKMTNEQLDGYMQTYFDDLLETVKSLDCDIVAHITCPLRYINGKYRLNIDSQKYRDKILKILDVMIEKSLALEVNTSGLGTQYGEIMPPKWILQEYKQKGGKLITLGSDAHTCKRVANEFENTLKLLLDCGFNSYFYYENRVPHKVKIF